MGLLGLTDPAVGRPIRRVPVPIILMVRRERNAQHTEISPVGRRQDVAPSPGTLESAHAEDRWASAYSPSFADDADGDPAAGLRTPGAGHSRLVAVGGRR